MATIANLNVNANDDSDSENDPDFIPNDIEDNDSDDSSDEDDERGTKRAKTDVTGPLTEEEKVKQAQERASLWADFQASVQPTTSSSTSTPTESTHSHQAKKLVKIQKRYRFAGEDVVEIVEVPEDSEDARKWPLWSNGSGAAEEATKFQIPRQGTSSEIQSQNNENINNTAGSSTQAISTSPPTTTQDSPVQSQNPKPKPKTKPKPKASLFSSLPTSTNAKPKQLTTFQKSAMDWRAHITAEDEAGSGVKDELEANRRAGGGGYLEKVEFLERVGQRREELFESGRSSKRRRG